MLLKDKPVLYYTLKAFLEAYDDLKVILVLPVEYTDMGQEIIDAYFDKDRIRITSRWRYPFSIRKKWFAIGRRGSLSFLYMMVFVVYCPKN